jgi:hypothetical protein
MMVMFAQFTSAAPIEPGTVERFQGAVPAPIATVWREHGAGLVGDGFVRLLDPGRASRMLDGVLGMPAGAVPVFATALADLVLYIEPLFHVVRFRFGVIDTLAFDAAALLVDLQREEYLDATLARQPYPAGVQRLGVPGIDECFGFVPLLTLGGRPDPTHLDRCGLWEHLAVIMQFSGPPRRSK